MLDPPSNPGPSKGYTTPCNQREEGDGETETGIDDLPQPPAAIPQIMSSPQRDVISAPLLGSHNTLLSCSNCRAEIQTRVEKKPSIVAWISAGIMCIFGLCCCCCVPFYIDSCLDTEHSCPNCGAHLGTHRAFN